MPPPPTPDFRADPGDRLHHGEDGDGASGVGGGLLLLLVLLAAVGAAWWWWWSAPAAPAPAAPVVATSAPAAPPDPPAGPQHPVTPEPSGPLADADVPGALGTLLGPEGLALLVTDGFAKRFVATVDNLGREHAPASAWPVRPTPGRFSVTARDGGTAIADANAARYAPLVRVAEAVDAQAAARLYRRLYPQLQAAYGELGFGKRYFNDRLVEVIDLLLATPEPAGPPQVTLTEVRGPVSPERPWVRYEFADPQLQSLKAGQKVLLRMGPDNARRLKAKLRQFRAALLAPAPGDPPR